MPLFSNFYKGTQMSHVILWVTGPKLTKFVHDVALLSPLLVRPPALRDSNPFGPLGYGMKVSFPTLSKIC